MRFSQLSSAVGRVFVRRYSRPRPVLYWHKAVGARSDWSRLWGTIITIDGTIITTTIAAINTTTSSSTTIATTTIIITGAIIITTRARFPTAAGHPTPAVAAQASVWTALHEVDFSNAG